MQNRQPLHVGLQPFRLSRRFSADNPGRRCSRSELGATPQGREEFRELAAWYTNLESSHHYANRPVLSTVTAPGYGSRARPVARGVSASTIRTMLCRGLRCLGSEFSEFLRRPCPDGRCARVALCGQRYDKLSHRVAIRHIERESDIILAGYWPVVTYALTIRPPSFSTIALLAS